MRISKRYIEIDVAENDRNYRNCLWNLVNRVNLSRGNFQQAPPHRVILMSRCNEWTMRVLLKTISTYITVILFTGYTIVGNKNEIYSFPLHQLFLTQCFLNLEDLYMFVPSQLPNFPIQSNDVFIDTANQAANFDFFFLRLSCTKAANCNTSQHFKSADTFWLSCYDGWVGSSLIAVFGVFFALRIWHCIAAASWKMVPWTFRPKGSSFSISRRNPTYLLVNKWLVGGF